MLENIEYLPKKNEFRVGDVKNLAVATNQKDDMSKMYPKVETNAVSNADMLNQSFGGSSVPNITVPNIETPKNESNTQDAIQISSIPNVQNTLNMENNPVDLSVNSSEQNGNIFSSTNEVDNLNVPSMDTQVNNTVPVVDTNLNLGTSNNIPVIEPVNQNNINPINSNNAPLDSGFKVSNEPNIFDNPTPFAISQEEINNPVDNNISPVDVPSPETNVFAEQTNLNSSQDNIIPVREESKSVVSDSINDDIILAQIAIEENNVIHYEALAENSKKKIELLKRQVKNNKKEDVNLENTASNLFNNNGVLDDEKVLGKIPMPNIMDA